VKDIIFREYDIRGLVGQELVIDQVYDLSRAIAYYFREQNPDVKTVAIGMDGRIHSQMIKEQMSRGFIESGIDVMYLGICPTPALYFSLHRKPVEGGLMITASHNGPEYNGIKICLGTTCVWGSQLQQIKNLYKEKKFIAADKCGAETSRPIVPLYVEWLSKHFKHLKGRDLSVVIDCGNGAAGTVLPDLIQIMKWKNVELLCQKVDGTYPNHEADPTVEKNMLEVKKFLQDTDIRLGIGLDGDCDRMAPMTKKGVLVPGDQLLALFAQQVLSEVPGAGIVFDIKASSGLVELLNQWGARSIMSPSGHSIIKDTMAKEYALLGGELSCHFFFKDRYFGFDDGIYAMLRLFEIITTSGKSLDELLRIFPKKYSSPELRLPCDEQQKEVIIESLTNHFLKRDDVSIIKMDGIRVTMPYGWGIVRASNTQSVLSMRFESDTAQGLKKVIDDFYEALKPHLGDNQLEELLNHKRGL
jgi:phosphomannomutase/phosphoglucomutase